MLTDDDATRVASSGASHSSNQTIESCCEQNSRTSVRGLPRRVCSIPGASDLRPVTTLNTAGQWTVLHVARACTASRIEVCISFAPTPNEPCSVRNSFRSRQLNTAQAADEMAE